MAVWLRRSMRSAPATSLTAAMGGNFAVFRIQNCGAKPFCAAGQVGLRAAVKTIFYRLSAARGHFASQNCACLRQGSACPLHAGILLRKTAPASGRGLLARCMRAFCFAKPQNPLFSKNRRGRICRTSIRRKCRFARLWLKRPGTVSACC